MKELYKSQIDIESLIFYVFLYSLFIVYPICSLSDSLLPKYLVIGSIPLFCYLIWSLIINIYYFYEDKIKIVYIFRFFKREKVVLYSDIERIRYIHSAGNKQARIALIFKEKSDPTLLLPSFSFTHRYFMKRKEILLFLHSKGIPIVINTVFKKDEEIFTGENAKNVTIEN